MEHGEVIGWVGATLLSLSALPQSWKSFKTKSSEGLSMTFLTMWLVGEVMCLIYVLPKHDMPLVTNYILNLVFLGVILRYKTKEKK
jgi:MtN3 and saliva related transmembrane protein